VSGTPRRHYARLARPLQALPEELQALWGDAASRSEAFQAILDAHAAGDGEALAAAIDRADRAWSEGMAALGYPRGGVRQVTIAPYGFPGQTSDDGEIQLGLFFMRRAVVQQKNPDTFVRTWLQESAHGRLPFAASWQAEYRSFRGYEEGFAEALALRISRDRAGMMPAPSTAYNYYRTAYEQLVEALKIRPDTLYRALWKIPCGEVRAGLPVIIVRLCKRGIKPDPDAVRAVCDELFAARNRGRRGLSAPDIIRAWRQVLP
jgi:hypothetical protein